MSAMKAFLSHCMRTDWFGPLIVIVIATLAISAFNPSFLSPLNIQVLLLAITVNMLIAFSQMIIIAIGQMNLSVGAIGGLAAIAFAGMMQVWGLPPLIAVAAALLIGLAAGAANGLFITFTGISAFVITLASLSIYKGVNLGITRAQPFYGVDESVKAFGSATLAPLTLTRDCRDAASGDPRTRCDAPPVAAHRSPLVRPPEPPRRAPACCASRRSPR